MATKDVGNGYKVSVDWAGGSTWVDIGQLQDVDPPEVTMGEVDTTCLDDLFTKYRPVELEDYGTFGFTVLHDPDDATHQAFYSNVILGTDGAWKLTPPGNSGTNTRTFTGFATSYKEGQVTPKGLLTAIFRVRLTSAITATP